MTRRWMICVLIELSMSMSGCNSVPAGLALPDGAHRVPVNQQPPVPTGVSLSVDGACP
ncbi:putative lipoprotein [Burkholderia contaminans]|uniref:Putative lipoprotein n=1 Tax=Burkholderia contaminans TaxID=488447 RepID=A0A6P3BV52_9BURK|nr:putative lipoprotein [Burkholderia contaminans]